jgi:hypothetical protein
VVNQLQSPNPAEEVSANAVQEAPPRGQLTMRLTICLIVGVFIVTVSVLYYKSWLMAPANPSALVIVRGDEAVAGATVEMQGPAGSFSDTLVADNKYICSFYAPPGRYVLRVTVGGVTRHEVFFRLGEYQYRTLTVGPSAAGQIAGQRGDEP